METVISAVINGTDKAAKCPFRRLPQIKLSKIGLKTISDLRMAFIINTTVNILETRSQ